MKRMIGRIFCLALCIFALACGAAMAEPVFTLDIGTGYITAVSMDPETKALVIPAKVSGEDVRGIAEDVFGDDTNLKYVRVDIANIRDLKNGSMDFRSAENLDYIFINSEVTGITSGKFKTNKGVEILQYLNLSDKSFAGAAIRYENGSVRLDFPEVSNYYGAINYIITRTSKSTGESVSFNSNKDLQYFSMSNGKVTFTDITAQPGEEYDYLIEATEPFGSSCIPCEMSISIPGNNPAVNPEYPPPETGDGANLILWAALAMMSAAGMMMIRRKKEA